MSVGASAAGAPVDFQREIRPILSQNCFLCHGPDERERKGGLRLDLRDDALKAGKSGAKAIVPGRPDQSELLVRAAHADEDERMPPAKSGKRLSDLEISLLRRWIAEGAPYAAHWSYVKPERPPLPEVRNAAWPRNGLDYFVLHRLEREGLEPAPEADRAALIRRVSLDLTGLPPDPAETAAFLADPAPDAYESLVSALLNRQAFGEHWARMWLDLARYADSAGYADDPLRTIWGFRDYVIDAFNQNKPFDQFTIEQIAGDLLPGAGEEQMAATAFHRNTMTNNEGGTNDEEFRSAAVVDRVNTTMAVWMGTSMACAQCHTHKYDPITQEEYFRFYALLNNTEDADRPDESPTLKLFTKAQTKERRAWEAEIAALEKKRGARTPELLQGAERWQAAFPREAAWHPLKAAKAGYKREFAARINEDAVSAGDGPAAETWSLEFPLEPKPFTALRIEVAGAASALITRVSAAVVPPKATIGGRYLRISLPGKDKILSLAEVQVFSGRENIAPSGEAAQSSTEMEAPAGLAIDGSTDGDFAKKSVTHTKTEESPWWELDLKAIQEISRVVIWNRTDGGTQRRLADFRVTILSEQREPLWEREVKEVPSPSVTLAVDSARPARLAGAFADTSRQDTDAARVLTEKADRAKGWAPAAPTGVLTLIAEKEMAVETGARLAVTIEAVSEQEDRLSFRAALAADPALLPYGRTPSRLLAWLAADPAGRDGEAREALTGYYIREVAPELQPERDRVAVLSKQLAEMRPYTLPVMRELAGEQRRKTHFQYRGNFMDLGHEVEEGAPAAFHPLRSDLRPGRLALAHWLADRENPLTARVTVNRFWEEIFGVGLVRTSEEFGSQGELPSHPELLDWLAVEFMDQKWDMKRFLRMLVTSATYRQSSRVTPGLAERDPENRLLARGPRVRLPAEAVRDQALLVAGLLSPAMKGPSVRPARPASGLSAAFGSSVDWKTSEGGDRFRRGLYTEWRRTSPYPSMTTFDAPNREVCTIRRNRTNTPLQALVTLNDAVYLEAAQGLARRMMEGGGSVADRIRRGFELCLSRPPAEREQNRLAALFGEALAEFAQAPSEKPKQMAGLGDGTAHPEPVELAAWTAVANVLLNLDETLMKR